MICDTCQKDIDPNRDEYWVSHQEGQEPVYRCELCQQERRIAEYERTGALTTRLTADAAIAAFPEMHPDEEVCVA